MFSKRRLPADADDDGKNQIVGFVSATDRYTQCHEKNDNKEFMLTDQITCLRLSFELKELTTALNSGSDDQRHRHVFDLPSLPVGTCFCNLSSSWYDLYLLLAPKFHV